MRQMFADVLNRLCSSEEQELERIRNLQKEVALHRRQNEASYKAALAGSEWILVTDFVWLQLIQFSVQRAE